MHPPCISPIMSTNAFHPLHHHDRCGVETGPQGPYDDSVPCTCYADTAQQDAHGYNTFIAKNFHDCVWSTREVISFAIGMSSIGFWLCAQAPQFYLNCKRQQASALSKCFLLEWLSGDLMNLVGTILTLHYADQHCHHFHWDGLHSAVAVHLSDEEERPPSRRCRKRQWWR